MFTGIVETMGTIEKMQTKLDCLILKILPCQKWDDLNLGDSISVNGVCLTINQFEDEAFYVSIVPETLRVTNLNMLALKESVNLERSMKLNARLGGHFVQGHVDQTSQIIDLKKDGEGSLLAKIQMKPLLFKYIVNKGYIAIDGMSITVIQSNEDYFTVTFIPFTQKVTRVQQYKIGTYVNLEVDILGKYIERLMRSQS